MAHRFTIKSYSLKELSIAYGCCSRTFKDWLQPFSEEVGPQVGRLFTPRQVSVIARRLGTPRGR